MKIVLALVVGRARRSNPRLGATGLSHARYRYCHHSQANRRTLAWRTASKRARGDPFHSASWRAKRSVISASKLRALSRLSRRA